MPEKPRTADEFVHGLAGIYSDRVFCHARNLMSSLPDNPELGSANVRQSPVDRYGEGIRKIPVSTFVIVYRASGDYVDVLALVYGSSIV